MLILGCMGCTSTLLSVSKYIEHSRADLENKSVTVGAHTIHYLEGGKGDSILLVHGFGGDNEGHSRKNLGAMGRQGQNPGCFRS